MSDYTTRAGASSNPPHDPTTNTVLEVERIMRDLFKPQRETVAVEDGGRCVTREIVFVPKGLEVKDLETFVAPLRERPLVRRGTATLYDIDSFIAWVNRFSDAESIIFADADPAKPSLTAVIDYHESTAGGPRWGRHRATYNFPLSREWGIWAGLDNKPMGQTDLAQQLEDRIADIVTPPVPPAEGEPSSLNEAEIGLLARLARLGAVAATPTRLRELARSFEVKESARVKSATNLSTGEAEIVYESEHRDAAGEKVSVPNAFVVQIPVFEGDAAYLLPIRLRYRKTGETIRWTFLRFEPQKFFEDALLHALKRVREGTKLPLLLGKPEAASDVS